MLQRKARVALMVTSTISALTIFSTVPAYALRSAAGGQSAQIEEVVVTAEKQSEILSKTPLAISVVRQNGLDKLNVKSAQDLVSTVPDLQTSANGYTTQFAIRGIGNYSGSYGTVATQVDGIYEPNTAALNNGLYDVSRVEVARGPQGTLYGRNATAGVVNIYTHDPDKNFELFGDIAYGNYSDFTARGVINIPLSDRVQVRGSVVRETNDGYYPKGNASRNYGAADILTTQLTVLAQLTDSLTWRVAYEHAENNGTLNYLQGVNYLYYPNADLNAGTLGNPVIVPARRNLMGQETVRDNSMDTSENAVRSRLTWNASDDLTITYLAGYSSFADNGYDSNTNVFASWQNGTETRATSHELDVNYNSDRLKAVFGLYYYWDDTSGNTGLHIGNTVPYPMSIATTNLIPAVNNPVGREPGAYGLIDIVQHAAGSTDTSKAAFTQMTYSLTDDLRMTGGLRYTEDKHSVSSSSQVCAWDTVTVPTAALSCGIPFGPPSHVAQSTKSNNLSWKAGLEYDLTPANLLYGSVSTGYRAGGVSGNALLPPQYLSYNPETVTDYELGWKSQMFDRSVVWSLALFDMEYNDMQVSAIEHDLNGNPTPVTINAAKSQIKGLEFEGDWRITPVDTLSGYATYLNARFSSFPNAVNASVNPDGIYNSVVAPAFGYGLLPTNVPYDFSGNALPNAPEESARVAYSHVFDLGSAGTFTPSIQFYWQGATYTDFANTAQAKRDAYSKSDLNLTYESESGGLTVTAYIHNLEDARVWQSANAKWDETMAFFYPPRTYGIRLGYKFY